MCTNKDDDDDEDASAEVSYLCRCSALTLKKLLLFPPQFLAAAAATREAAAPRDGIIEESLIEEEEEEAFIIGIVVVKSVCGENEERTLAHFCLGFKRFRVFEVSTKMHKKRKDTKHARIILTRITHTHHHVRSRGASQTRAATNAAIIGFF